MTPTAVLAGGAAALGSAERLAVQMIVGQGALFAAETIAIHQIGSRMSVMQIALIRGVAGVALAFALAKRAGIGIIKTEQLALQIFRGCVSLLYLWVMIYSFSHLPFADATAISYTQVAYIAVFSVLILGEAVSSWRWMAVGVGILGALLIAKPAFAGWDGAYLIAVVGTSLNGLAFVLNRYLQRQDSEATTVFYTNLVVVVGSLPALATYNLPIAETYIWMPGLLLFGPVGMYLGVAAVKRAPASMLGPYTLLRLVIGVFIGVTFFEETPDMFSACGSALILSSCMLSTWFGARKPARA